MAGSRRADAVLFGFDFQVNAAIVLMLENILDLKSLRLEGESEDIELKLNDNEYILAQAKAVVKSCEDFSNVRANLKKSLISLSEGAKKTNAGVKEIQKGPVLIKKKPPTDNKGYVNTLTLIFVITSLIAITYILLSIK